MAVEEGWLCDKGRWGYPAAWSADRILRPLVRDADGTMVETSLEAAVDAAARLIGAASSTRIMVGAASTVEDGFLAQELAAVLPNATASRLGFPDSAELEPLRALPRAELGDIDTAGAVVVVGGDVANRHPIVELRLRKVVRNRGTLAMVGPRTSPLDARATYGARTAPGQLASGFAVIATALEGASSPVIIWDEADVANEPAAAAELARIAAVAGARQIELAADVNGQGLRALGLAAQTGPVATGALVAVNADPLEAPGSMAWADAMDGVGSIIAVATHRSAITERADVVLPSLMHHEIEGVLVSTTGRAQRLRPGSRGPREAAAAWELLIALSHRTGTPLPFRTPAQSFAAVAAARAPFDGMSYSAVGDEGAPTTYVANPSAPQRSTSPVGEGIPLVVTTEIFGDAVSWRSDALVSRRTPAHLVLAPQQAQSVGVAHDQRARVSSPFGTCILPVVIDADAPEGAAFVALGPPASGATALLAGEQVPVNVVIEVAE
jgi:NADH-quinone oxidoreductase subunit G